MIKSIFIETPTDGGNLFTCSYYSRHSVRPLRVFPSPESSGSYSSDFDDERRSIGAARMYRSLSNRGSLSEYEYASPFPNFRPGSCSQSGFPTLLAALLPLHRFRSPDLPQFQSGTSNLTAQRSGPDVLGPMQFASVTPSEGTWSMCEAPVFIPADQTQVEFIPE